MKIFKFILLFAVTFPGIYFAQDIDSLKGVLNAKFESFEYNSAIEITNILLSEKVKLPKTDQIEILRIKAVALYNLSNEDSARIIFIQLLELENNYFMDPVKNSPKIVEFFNNIKISQKNIVDKETNNNHPQVENPKKAVEIPQKEITYNYNNYKGMVLRSILFPGWGHFEGGKSTKGWIFGSAGLITLSSMIYSIIDCYQKEKDYLLDDDRFTIEDKYNVYNKSYKFRNISIIAFAAVWIYTQVDLLYLSDFEAYPAQVGYNKINNSDTFFISYRVYF